MQFPRSEQKCSPFFLIFFLLFVPQADRNANSLYLFLYEHFPFTNSGSMRRSSFVLCLYCTLLAFLFSPHISLLAQTAALFNINTNEFPSRVGGNFFVIDSAGRSVRTFSPANVRIAEEGAERRVISVSCPDVLPPRALSVVLTIDVSGSMSLQLPNSMLTNMQIAKQAAVQFVNAIQLGTSATQSEMALTSFDDKNYLNQDWTTDKTKLLSAIQKLQPQGGTNYDAGFLKPPSPAADVASTGKNKRIVIFLTDGFGFGSEDNIVEAAVKNDITIYTITLGVQALPVIRNIAQRTGGLCFENVRSADETTTAFLNILQTALGTPPCLVTWESATGCAVPRRPVTMSFPAISVRPNTSTGTVGGGMNGGMNTILRAESGYEPPPASQVALRVSPSQIQFPDSASTLPQERVVTVTASNANFTVRDIVLSGDSAFSISPRNFTLRAGESRTLTVRITARPAIGGYALGEFVFLTDTCPAPRLFASVYSTTPPSSPTIRLIFPNGSEEFLAGTDSLIRWTGVSPLDTVRLEFSIDSGRTWQTITNEATGLVYKWEQIPNLPSNRCLMRVTQLVASPQPDVIRQIPTDVTLARLDVSGNTIVSTRGPQTLFWSLPNIQFVAGAQRHQNTITDIAFSPDSTSLATTDESNALVTWNARTGQFTGGIVGNIGRVVTYSPDGRILAVAGADAIRFYEAGTNQLAHIIIIAQGGAASMVAPRRLTFSPDGETLGLVRANGTMLFWRVRVASSGSSMGTGLGTITTSGINAPWGTAARSIRDGVFQQESGGRRGNLLAIAVVNNARSSVEVWNRQTQALVRTLVEFPAALNIASVNFSRDGSRIITGYANGVSLWNLSSGGTSPQQRVRFRAPVSFAEFHPDGRRFLAVSGDVGIFYTFSDPFPLQSDSSDRVWSIVAPDAVADSVNMGAVTVGEAKDSVVRVFVRNTGTYPVRVDSLFFTGAHANEFEVVSGVPASIPVGAGQYVEFRFRPSVPGERRAVINIALQHTVLQYSIVGVGVVGGLQISPRIIDFRAVLVGTRRDSTVRAVVRNTGNSPVTITSIALGGPDGVQFFLLSGTSGFTLAAGETRSVQVRFSPAEIGRTSGSLLFYVGSGNPVVVQLFGQGVASLPPPPCTLRLLDTSARPNDRICLSLIQSCSAPSEISTSVTVLVSFNASLLAPQGMTPQGVVANGIRYVPITLNLFPVSSNASISRLDTRPLQNLCFDVALGNTTATRLNVEVIDPPGASINATSATFRLITSLAGGTHLYFAPPSRLTITSIAPNPVNDQFTIRFNNVFVESLTLTIVDIYGRVVQTQTVMATAQTGNEASVNVRDLPPGVYVVRVRSPRETASQRIAIVR